jgi:hypothetical protein
MAIVSRTEMKGTLNREVPYVCTISSKLRVSLCVTVLNGGSPKGGNPSATSPKSKHMGRLMTSVLDTSLFNNY